MVDDEGILEMQEAQIEQLKAEFEKVHFELKVTQRAKTANDKRFQLEIEDLKSKLDYARNALELIAMGVRPDGTYNRSREACEQLAKAALARIEE